jgi:hypothetical protein
MLEPSALAKCIKHRAGEFKDHPSGQQVELQLGRQTGDIWYVVHLIFFVKVGLGYVEFPA